ncbi:MAG: endonuclease III domain-containing protein [Thermomicrobiales bacterium]
MSRETDQQAWQQSTPAANMAGTQIRISRVIAVLDDVYGPRQNIPSCDPLDGLIGTILSQATSDVNSRRAHHALRAAYPTWAAVLAAPDDELADVIRSGGLANLKARRIKDVLATIKEERGDFDLASLASLPLEEAIAWLRRLPGVGPKTAACVLLFDLGRPALPVDTHVYRVSRRLGLIGSKVSAEAAHTVLQEQLAPEDIYAFHVEMIAHGRKICRAGAPKCEICPLASLCDYYHYQQRAVSISNSVSVGARKKRR